MSIIVKAGKKVKKVMKAAGIGEKEHRVSYIRRYERIKTDKRICAMTFDDGPMNLPAAPDGFGGKAMTEVLLDACLKYGAHVTFDIIGDTSENYPDKAGSAGSPSWGGVKFDHYPDINRDNCGGAVHAPFLIQRMLNEGHELSNHGYRHIIFGKKPFVYGAREHFNTIDEVTEDLAKLHSYIKDNFGYEMTLSRPPHYVDKIGRGLTSYDAYALMNYGYMAASYDGGGWLPSSLNDSEAAQKSEVDAMIQLIKKKLDADPDFFCGQIIFQKDGYNMAKRTPVAYALEAQLDLLYKNGYKVVSVSELLEESPFADVGRDCEIFDTLAELEKNHAIAFDDNTLRLDKIMTNYELSMFVCPKNIIVNERIKKIKCGGKYISEYDAALKFAKAKGIIPPGAQGKEPATVLPGSFRSESGFSRFDALKKLSEQEAKVSQPLSHSV